MAPAPAPSGQWIARHDEYRQRCPCRSPQKSAAERPKPIPTIALRATMRVRSEANMMPKWPTLGIHRTLHEHKCNDRCTKCDYCASPHEHLQIGLRQNRRAPALVVVRPPISRNASTAGGFAVGCSLSLSLPRASGANSSYDCIRNPSPCHKGCIWEIS